MIMKTLIRTFILFFCITGLASCYAGIPLKSGKSENNQTYEVSYLFEHDGVKVLLMDIAADREYRAAFEREEAFWLQQLIDVLTHCKICGYLLPGVDPDRFAPDLQEVIYQSSLQGTPYLVQRMLNYTLLRGLFKMDGIRYIDEHLKPDNLNVCV